MDKIIRNVGGVIRESANIRRGKGPRSAQTAMIIAGYLADGAAALFAVSTCIRILSDVIKGKK